MWASRGWRPRGHRDRCEFGRRQRLDGFVIDVAGRRPAIDSGARRAVRITASRQSSWGEGCGLGVNVTDEQRIAALAEIAPGPDDASRLLAGTPACQGIGSPPSTYRTLQRRVHGEPDIFAAFASL